MQLLTNSIHAEQPVSGTDCLDHLIPRREQKGEKAESPRGQ